MSLLIQRNLTSLILHFYSINDRNGGRGQVSQEHVSADRILTAERKEQKQMQPSVSFISWQDSK